ncbi:MAG: Holliday junction resolvase RuvX [Planctomycetota bacterium]
MRYLAIDYGTKRTGLAICDAAETVASPLSIIQGRKNLLKRIAETAKAESVQAIVLGLPLSMDGTESAQTRLVLKFAEQLREHLAIPVHLQDERLSSFAAEEKLAPANYTRSEKGKRLDAVAAAAILEAFLEEKTARDDGTNCVQT